MGKKRKSKEERLEEIFEAAKKMFLKKGFPHTTMEDIIGETELSKGGFYHYYGNTADILIDIMRSSNIKYMKFNPFMLKLNEHMEREDKIELILNAFLDKCLTVTEDKMLYTMFSYEAMHNQQIWDVYLEMEEEFFLYIIDKLGLDKEEANRQFLFVSRLLNAILFAQNLSREPEVFESEKETLKQMIRPYVTSIMQGSKAEKKA